MRVLLIGGVSMDLLFELQQPLTPPQPVIQATHFAAHPGGKAFNLGVVLRRLFPTVQVDVLAAMGGADDLFSVALRQALLQADLRPDYLRPKADHAAPIVGIFRSPADDVVTIPYEATGHALDEHDLDALDFAKYEVVLATGEIRPSVAFAAFHRLKAVRPSALTIYNIAPAHLLAGQAATLAQHPLDYLFVNVHEALSLLGFSTFPADHDLLETLSTTTRIPHICLTLGAQGGMLHTPQAHGRFPIFEVAVQSPVGAGDTFVASFIGGLLAGFPVRAIVRYASAAAAVACLDAVAIGAQLTPTTIEQLLTTQGTRWDSACEIEP